MNPLKQLENCGQSPWLDYVRRSLIRSGELATLIERDGLKGVTSNPSIFQKGIGESEEYVSEFHAVQGKGSDDPSAIYEHIAIGDIKEAADVLRPVYEASNGRDGYISLECSPYLANDTEATLAEARRLWGLVDKPNLMVKVPATPAGIPAIRTLIGEGININITLLFAVSAYEKVVEAYIAGLETLAGKRDDLSRIGSVASFFVSRIDTLVEKRIDAGIARGEDKAPLDALRGKVAIANAKVAYALYKQLFSGPRWDALVAKGAHTQRLLWASTGTKNPAYPDTLYVDRLIGRDTVNTMPPATMDAYRDHGTAKPHTVEDDVSGARATLLALESHGISLDEVTGELVEDGVHQFADAFDKLFATIKSKNSEMREDQRKAS